MSDEGFHEIQLSGKQLVFLFMSAVVLAVVIFLLGVDVGRGVPGAAGDTAVAVNGAPAEPSAGDAAAGGTTAVAEPELSYHELLLGETAPAGAPAGESAAPAQPAAPPAISEPAGTPPPTAAPPVTAGQWVLQMGAYSTRAVADDQVAKLKQLKAPAFVLAPTAASPDKLFRVRVGPYADRAEAEQAKSRLERQGFPSLITR